MGYDFSYRAKQGFLQLGKREEPGNDASVLANEKEHSVRYDDQLEL